MHQVMTRPSPVQLFLPCARTPSTRARSRATEGFSAITSCMPAVTLPAYRRGEARGCGPRPLRPEKSRTAGALGGHRQVVDIDRRVEGAGVRPGADLQEAAAREAGADHG